MTTPFHRPRNHRRRWPAVSLSLMVLALALGGASAGCSSDHGTPAGNASMPDMTSPAEAAVPLGHQHMPTAAEVEGAWAARPDYVRTGPADYQAAYAYALARPDVLQWLPCYCGCVGMGHRSNLDCFFQRREQAGDIVYEEHASYCGICVETANLAQQLLRKGSTMIQVRAAVDARFGNTAPGTDTPLPPPS